MSSKKYLFGIIALLFVQYGYSQYRFESGYYISNDGTRIECLIEKKEWASWSNEFFNASINDSLKRIEIANVKEFGIDNKLKFITQEVQIERSSNDIEKLDRSRDFIFKKERILLKVILEGDLSLYQYLDTDVKKFFFKTPNGDIEQLKHKRYIDKNYGDRMILNEVVEYRNQLKENFKCANYDFDKLNYELRSIRKYVLNQNKCANSEVKFLAKHLVQPRLAVSASVGLNISTLDVTRARTNFTLNSIDPSFGTDLDFLIPTTTGDIEINFKAYYSSFSAKDEVDFGTSTAREVQVDYSEISLSIGGGYRFYIDNNISLTFGGAFNYPILLDDVKYTEAISNLNLFSEQSNPFVSISAGLHIKRISFRVESQSNRIIMSDTNNFLVDLSRILLRIGYEIF
jgi:hypothetical protein